MEKNKIVSEILEKSVKSLNEQYFNLKTSHYVKYLLTFANNEKNKLKKNRKVWENKICILESIANGLILKQKFNSISELDEIQ